MDKKNTNHPPEGRLIFFLSLFIVIYWISGRFYNPYNLKLTGILFEILWIPMIILLFIIPLYCIYKLINQAENPGYYWYYWCSLITNLIAFGTLIFR